MRGKQSFLKLSTFLVIFVTFITGPRNVLEQLYRVMGKGRSTHSLTKEKLLKSENTQKILQVIKIIIIIACVLLKGVCLSLKKLHLT